jgi:hypothetical protein
MAVGKEIIDLATSDTGKQAIGAIIGLLVGGIATRWKLRDRYRAHVTIQSTETMYGQEDLPVIVIQSVHDLPINVTRLRLRDGFGRKVDRSPFYAEDLEDYPTLPRTIEPKQSTKFWLDEGSLEKGKERSRLLNWLWVPRVYIGVETMGRGERLFQAEGGLHYNERRKRFRL